MSDVYPATPLGSPPAVARIVPAAGRERAEEMELQRDEAREQLAQARQAHDTRAAQLADANEAMGTALTEARAKLATLERDWNIARDLQLHYRAALEAIAERHPLCAGRDARAALDTAP